jgi:hypothetical protein
LSLTNVFSQFVAAGEVIKVDEVKTDVYTPSIDYQDAVAFEIYASPRPVKFVTEPGCERIGRLTIHLSAPARGYGIDRQIQLSMTFGNTELAVTATEVDTDKTVQAVLNFLG